MSNIDNPTNMRDESCPFGGDGFWAVIEDADEFGVPPCESNNWGLLAIGMDWYEAQTWLDSELRQRQGDQAEELMFPDEDDESCPW